MFLIFPANLSTLDERQLRGFFDGGRREQAGSSVLLGLGGLYYFVSVLKYQFVCSFIICLVD
jgi:hypothetical protein